MRIRSKARERLNKPAVSDMHAGSHVSLITHPLPTTAERDPNTGR